MTALIVSITIWAVVMISTFNPFWRVAAGKGSDHDPLFSAFFTTAVLMQAFNLRWLIAPNSQVVLDALRYLGAALATFLIVLTRFYKR